MSFTDRVKEITGIASTSDETLSPSSQFKSFLMGSNALQNSEFMTDIFNTDIEDPHSDMRDAFKMQHTNPDLAAALSTRANIIIGRNLSVESDDEDTVEFFENEVLPELKKPLRTGVQFMGLMGNGYIEVIRQNGVPVNFEEVDRPHKFYLDFGEGFEVTGYVEDLPSNSRGKTYDIKYWKGRHKQVTGQRFDEDEMLHLTEGNSVVPKYGRSVYMSAIDDHKINREIMRSLGVIAKQKSIPRKIINVNTAGGDAFDEPGSPNTSVGQNAQKGIEQQLSSLDDYENLITHNKDISVEDYSYDTNIEGLQNVTTELQRSITSGMPGYITHPQDSNEATAKIEKPTFYLEVESVRENVADTVNPVLQEIAEANGYDTDVTLEFGEFDFPIEKEKKERAVDQWMKGVITLNEARKELGFDELEQDEDDEGMNGDVFRWDVADDNQINFGNPDGNGDSEGEMVQYFGDEQEEKHGNLDEDTESE